MYTDLDGRTTTEHAADLGTALARLHATDAPPAAVRAAGEAVELMRQLPPLARRGEDTERVRHGHPPPPGGRIDPEAPEALHALTTRLATIADDLDAQVWPDWDTPAGRMRLAEQLMPTPEQRTRLAERVRGALGDDLAEAARLGHPEAQRLRDLIEQAAAGMRGHAPESPTRCQAPGCAAALPAPEPGRQRRYCTPACRRRARRTTPPNP